MVRAERRNLALHDEKTCAALPQITRRGSEPAHLQPADPHVHAVVRLDERVQVDEADVADHRCVCGPAMLTGRWMPRVSAPVAGELPRPGPAQGRECGVFEPSAGDHAGAPDVAHLMIAQPKMWGQAVSRPPAPVLTVIELRGALDHPRALRQGRLLAEDALHVGVAAPPAIDH